MIFTQDQVKKDLNIPVVGDTIKITRKVALAVKNQMGLQFHPIVLDVTKIQGVNDNMVTLSGKLTQNNGGICRCCGKTLKTEMSKLTGFGPVCSKFVGVQHPKTKEEIETYKEKMAQKIEQIGEFDITLPKNHIKKWDGLGSMFLKIK